MTTRYSPFADDLLNARLKKSADRCLARSPSALLNEHRFTEFSMESDGLWLDASRQRVDQEALHELIVLAERAQLADKINALMSGERVNNTEHRAALHTACRLPAGATLTVDGENVADLVQTERRRQQQFAHEVNSGGLRGFTGERFTDVVNIGIGGSDLGPVMVTQALKSHRQGGVHAHFVSAIDGVQWHDLAERLNPATTLILICSKTFSTIETLTNARLARAWLVAHLGEQALPSHVAAVSTNHAAMDEFGVGPQARFQLWDWVGGRYSVWSAIGLAARLTLGNEVFDAFLAGGHAMDQHFRTAAFAHNLPVVLGLLSFWNRVVLNIPSRAVLPYDQRLERFPAYLQQLTMESNGKRVRRDGSPVLSVTGPLYWGEPGNNSQHSFFQWLHQGTDLVAMDILLPIHSSVGYPHSQRLTIANALAQAEAFAFGHSQEAAMQELVKRGVDLAQAERLAQHKVHPGGRPVSLMVFDALTPFVLGQLVALYEHQVYVESVLLDINPFDQWGVELGKAMAVALEPSLAGTNQIPLRADLQALLEVMRARGLA